MAQVKFNQVNVSLVSIEGKPWNIVMSVVTKEMLDSGAVSYGAMDDYCATIKNKEPEAVVAETKKWVNVT